MSGTGTVEGGRPLLRGKVLGFPVHLDLSFVLIMGILGYYPGVTLAEMVIWLLITPVAVLVHELGHAVTAKTTGAHPEIALAGFGGVTTYVPKGPVSRARSLLISLSGPAVGLAIGAALILVQDAAETGGMDPFGWTATALRIGIWTCVGWSVLNLFPVLPLDGGQAMRELLPGAPAVRERRAAQVSVVTGLLGAVVAYLVFSQPFVAVFMLLFVVINVLSLRGPRPDRMPPEGNVVRLLWQGRPAEARELLQSLPPEANIDLAVNGAVQAVTGEREQGLALIRQEVARRPAEEGPAAMLALAQLLLHDWDGLIGTLQGPSAAHVPPPVVERAVAEARGTGREDVAGRLASLRPAAPPA